MNTQAVFIVNENITIQSVRSENALQLALAIPSYHIIYVRKGKLTLVTGNTVLRLSPKTMTLVNAGDGPVQIKQISLPSKLYIVSVLPAAFEKEIQATYLQSPITSVAGEGDLYGLTPLGDRVITLLLKGFLISDAHAQQNTSGLVACFINLLCGQFMQQYASPPGSGYTFLSIRQQLVMRFRDLVQSHCNENHGVRYYADKLCVTRGHLTKIMKETGNNKPKQYIAEALISKSKELLLTQRVPITTISEILGFTSPASFSTFFKKHAGITPSEYRKGDLKT